ncbi:putative deoxyribonuclease [Escherichia coli]|uniref:Putative deoxyribonuclease n=2 Tax=Escherichia coli TaxID=562 RepID=A0A485JKD0_ECOLX|nr:putative deoxyribonuclease [Escherichia coli]
MRIWLDLPFIDTHCHFDFPPFSGDEEASLQRAAQAGVGKIIVPATEAANFARVLALAENYQPLYAALGLHPGMLEKHSDASLEQLQQALERHPAKVVAVGEIGLDLFGDDPQFERQQWLLDEQLKLAKRYDLPVILHSRRAHDKLAMHLKRHDLSRTGVVHGFSRQPATGRAVCTAGLQIGVGGTITYPRASKTRDVIAKLPLASLLLETDAPDMPLNGFQGQPNRPEQAARVFDVLCELRPEPADEIAQALLNNTYTLFNVP